MDEYEVKFKRVDTGKYWGAGKLKEGKYGPQIGMKVSPELKEYLDSVPVGQWLNFNLYSTQPKPEEQKNESPEIDDQIPF